MALVLMPCDVPSWPAVQRHLNAAKSVQTSMQLVDIMHNLHDLCCVSLDPDENDRSDIEIFKGFQEFLDAVLSIDERNNFFLTTLPALINYALRLRLYRPTDGWQYSLQQQADSSDLDRKFVASLMANAFFSTFPRRTTKTHPTLQDCNFSRFFVHLKRQDQQKKLRSLFEYFDRISVREPTGKVVFIRKVTPKMVELDLDDWLQCSKLLCPVTVRHDDRAKQMESGSLKVYFGSSRVGGLVLDGGGKQEDMIFGVFPELLVALMSTERIEPNEAFTAHGMLPIGGSSGIGISTEIDDVSDPFSTHVCLAEAMDLSTERHLLDATMVRELNKALTAFRQETVASVRLRPIGKSLSATPPKDLSPIREVVTPLNTSMPLHQDDVCGPSSMDVVKPLIFKKSGLVNDDDDDNDNRTDGDPVTCKRVLMGGGAFTFELSKIFQGVLGRDRADNKGDFDSDDVTNRRIARVVPRPAFVQNNRLVDRGDSEDSFHADNLAEGKKMEERIFASRCGGIMFSKPLKLFNSTKQVPMCSPLAVDQERAAQTSQTSPLDNLTSMEASFVSCRSHNSSSSSPDEDADSADEYDDVEGFQSCSEELDDVCDVPLTDSRRTTIADEDLQSEFEERAMHWGRRVESGPVNCRRMNPSMSCTTDSLDDADDADDDSSNIQDSIADECGLRLRRGCMPRRATSTGFILNEEDQMDDEEDIFVGDAQLEHEREWLAGFRHRSANPSRSSMSRADSSRYSFSSDFSSDLEDIYEHFEEKMTEGPVRDDPTFRSRPGDRLKRTLSDSLASFPRVTMMLPRSLSLTEKMQMERMNIAQAKQHQRDGGALNEFANFEEYYDYSPLQMVEDQTKPNATSMSSCCNRTTVERLVGTADVAIKQNLCDVDERIALSLLLPRPKSRLVRLPSQLSVWWNYNSVYDFCVPLSPRGQSNLKKRMEDDDDYDTMTVAVGSFQRPAPEGWPLTRMPSKRSNRETDKVHRHTFLQVPSVVSKTTVVCRRSKSATNYEELAKTFNNSSSDSVDGIVKSRSLTTVLNVRQDGVVGVTLDSSSRTGKTSIPDIGVESERQSTGLRKWHAAFNLNDLSNGGVENLDRTGPFLESSSAGKQLTAGTSITLDDDDDDGDDRLWFSASRRNVAPNVVSSENVHAQSRDPERSLKTQRGAQRDKDDCSDHPDAADKSNMPIETGNWVYANDVVGEGADPQLMALIVWMAASRANAPSVIYHTGGDQRVVKLSIVSRVLLDRRWSVGHIARAILSHYAAPSRRKSPDTEQDVDILESLLPKETDL